MPRGSHPGERRGGRKKGTPNKITRTLSEAIDKAFEMVGGADYLAKVAEDDPKAFCGLLGKRLPRDIKLDATTSLTDLLTQARERRSQGG
jgi:hypothetical protein